MDIETTGLYPEYSEITVVGIYLTDGDHSRFTQLVGADITADSIEDLLQRATTIYTYNGSRFDIPFIRNLLGINLAKLHTHCDLMYHCWNKNLYGGLKSVERQLGIGRRMKGVDGYEAVRLWWRYVNDYDQNALRILLEYNKEDVINLKALKDLVFKW